MWIPIGAALLVNMFVGGIWYSPMLFCNVFLETHKKKKGECHMGAHHMIGCILFGLLECFGLYYVIVSQKAKNVADGALLGYYLWQFFVCPTIGVHYLFNGRPIKELLVVWGHHLVNFILEGAIITLLA